MRGFRFSLPAMWTEVSRLNLLELAPVLQMPVFLLLGRKDHWVRAEISMAYLDALSAPSKKVVWFEESGHEPFVDEPAKFKAVMAEQVRPTLAPDRLVHRGRLESRQHPREVFVAPGRLIDQYLAMTDSEIAAKIEALVAEEHRLGTPGPDDDSEAEADRHARLEAVKVELDRCWDLLRQRRGREEFGLDPDEVSARPADVVENYEQ